MQARIKWIEDVRYAGDTGSGHSVIMDGPPEYGGTNTGFRPMEMLLLGLGGCAAFDVMMILKKSRQHIEDCEVFITAERDNDGAKTFTKINVRYELTGNKLNLMQVERAIKLSSEKYCSVSVMLSKAVNISYDFNLNDLNLEQ